MRTRRILGGIKSYLYWLLGISSQGKGGKETGSARYCYSVWLRHLSIACENGMAVPPEKVAELGPGASIGMGLAGLLSGAKNYSGLDVVDFQNGEKNIEVLEGLVDLFRKREDIPNHSEFPKVKPFLKSYQFPHQYLTEECLNDCMQSKRIKELKDNILSSSRIRSSGSFVHYISPWFDSKVIQKESMDLIFSQAVLEHVDDLDLAYDSMYAWLKPGGYMSHVIDFKSHEIAEKWNGHWSYSDLTWKLIRGKKPYLLNREPLSTHLKAHEKRDERGATGS